MNIIDITSTVARNKVAVLNMDNQPFDCQQARNSEKHQVKVDVKKILMLQNKLTTTTI